MADSILRLKVESSEYDAKLKKAAEGIRHLADVAHKGGGELTGLEKSELDYIKALGDMETKSRTASGQVRELTGTYKELKVVYDQLNDVEKADEGGKALAASLDRLRQRAQEAKSSLDNASKSLETQGGLLDSMKDKLVINIDAMKLFNLGLSAAKGALDVAKDAFFASEENIDNWGRTVETGQAIYEGFLTAINTGDISGYLSRIDQITQAARDAYDELDRLSTQKAIDNPRAQAQRVENERFRAMLRTGRYIAPNDGRRATMAEGTELTADQKKRIASMLENGMKTANSIVASEIKQTTRAINALYKEQASVMGMSEKEFRKGTATMEEFNKRLEGYKQYRQFEREHTTYDGRSIVGHRDKAVNPYAEYAAWGVFKDDGKLFQRIQELINQRAGLQSQNYANTAQAYRAINTGTRTTGGGRGGNTTDTLSKIAYDENKAMLSGFKTVDTMPSVWAMADKNAMRSSMNGWNDIGTFLGMPPSIWDALRKQTGLGYQQFDPNKDISKQWKLNKKGQLTDGKDDEQSEKNQANMIQGIETINTSLQSIFGGIEKLGFEIPQELNNIFGVVQTIVGIVSAIQTLSTVKLFGLANSGIVPHAAGSRFITGNSFSGDNIFAGGAFVNAGELVLNKAHQNALAGLLSGGGLSQLQLEAIVTGEDLRFVINNNGRRTGRGEIVTTNFR